MGLIEDVVIVGGIAYALHILSRANSDLPGDLPGLASRAAGQAAGAAVGAAVDLVKAANAAFATGWYASYGNDGPLNASIDQWFGTSSGFFGLFGWDPTNWGNFSTWVNQFALPGFRVSVPAYATGYFNAKVEQYRNKAIGGLGY